MQYTFLGHSSFLFNIGGYKIIVDPFITPNELASDIKVEDLEADYVMLTHAHQDHIFDAEAILKRTGATLISNWEVTSYYQKLGIEKVHPMNIGGKWSFDFATVSMTYAQHSSSFPDGTYGGNPAGFVLETDEKTIYISGDTGLFSDMGLIGKMFKPNTCFLPIGDNFTMGLDEALQAMRWLDAKNMVAMHFDTFPYIIVDKQEAKLKASAMEINLVLPEIGKTYTV